MFAVPPTPSFERGSRADQSALPLHPDDKRTQDALAIASAAGDADMAHVLHARREADADLADMLGIPQQEVGTPRQVLRSLVAATRSLLGR